MNVVLSILQTSSTPPTNQSRNPGPGAQSFFDSASGAEGIQSAFLSRAHVHTPLGAQGDWAVRSRGLGATDRAEAAHGVSTWGRGSEEESEGEELRDALLRASNMMTVVVDVEPTFRL